ncbi:hypothetical protein [Pseudorhodoferax sp.]|uniref:hypothetical protein n=1 Tax=Pseudorhodoferax sp. TaxID=1993553 RepID=UPI002DD63D61|nr:hypothetical protein [Pseudorhodoferax sp.]
MRVHTETLRQPTVRAAIEALHSGDRAAWTQLFADGARLFDDGKPRELARFTQDALGHERFTTLDEVSEDGLEVRGMFHSDQWGDFRTYFRFTLGADGRVVRLDIGQAE